MWGENFKGGTSERRCDQIVSSSSSCEDSLVLCQVLPLRGLAVICVMSSAVRMISRKSVASLWKGYFTVLQSALSPIKFFFVLVKFNVRNKWVVWRRLKEPHIESEHKWYEHIPLLYLWYHSPGAWIFQYVIHRTGGFIVSRLALNIAWFQLQHQEFISSPELLRLILITFHSREVKPRYCFVLLYVLMHKTTLHNYTPSTCHNSHGV